MCIEKIKKWFENIFPKKDKKEQLSADFILGSQGERPMHAGVVEEELPLDKK